MKLKHKAKKRYTPVAHGAATSNSPEQKYKAAYAGRIPSRAGEMKYTDFRGKRH